MHSGKICLACLLPFVTGILKFNAAAKSALEEDVSEADNVTLVEFLTRHDIPESVSQYYLLPMVSAIWSASLADAKDFPLGFSYVSLITMGY